MADIVSWSPIDDNNNAAPPDGWPEGQMPSTVNNTARGMMGALRRWYDTVTAQIASLTTALGNYLPLTGGTLTGALSAPQYNINGIVFANSDSTTLHIYDRTGLSAIHLEATINSYDADTHVFRSNAGANTAIIDSVGNLTLNNYLHFAESTGTVNTTGGPLLYADTSNHVYKQGSGNGAFLFQNYAGSNVATINASGVISAASLGVTGTVTGSTVTSTGAINAAGNITAPAFIGNVTVPASGPISTGGTVTGGTVTSTGNITAAGSITASGPVSASGYQTRAGTAGAATGNYFNIEWRPGAHLWIDNVHQGSFVLDTGSGISTSSVYAPSGYTTTGPNGGSTFQMVSITGYSYIRFLPNWYWEFNASGDASSGAMVWFIDRSGPKEFWYMRASDSMCLNYLGPVAGLGAYVNTSDRRGKKNIAPSHRGLAEVLELTPVEFDRISDVDTPREIGFIAQDVKDVMPEAVRVVGMTLPDGTGGLDDAEPTLGLTDSTIVAALVNAVKTLNSRIATLEEARHV